ALIHDSRIVSSQNLIPAMPASVKHYISASAISFYPSDDTRCYTEQDSRAVPTKPSDFASRIVHDWEAAADKAARQERRVVKLRIGLVLGDSGLLARLLPVYRMGLGGPIGDGRQWLSWIHVTDLIQAVQFILDDEQISGPVNLAAPQPERFQDFSRTLASVLNRPHFLRVPRIALQLGMGEAAELALASICMQPKRLLDAGFRFEFPELENALQDLTSGPARL
ncbi:MAG: TIGR01777 family oxidoreductase, partial [Leptospiraceae bacterium]|nr:TIGR01777 family oxidoreductase [Leptospiraceae bacterium]